MARIGATWIPNGGQAGADSGERDAWGVRKSFGWAAGETLAINNVAGVLGMADHMIDRIVQPVLIFLDQLTEGFRAAV